LERIRWWHEDRRSQVPGLAVVRAAKADPRHDGQPSKIRVRKSQLMERVETIGAVILETGVLGKLEPQICKAGLTFIKDRTAKKRVALDVQYHFRLAFRGSEEVVRLKTLDAGESENRICLC